MQPVGSPNIIGFGVFELDVRAGELRKRGVKIKLQNQPVQILTALLQHPGEVVTREELQKRLWPTGTFVDVDHSLSSSINKVREVVGDTADNPRFIETVGRRGYRFLPFSNSRTAAFSPDVRFSGEDSGTDEKEPNELLVQSVQEYAIFTMDVYGCITTWNAGAQRITGYRADEIIGRHFSCFYPRAEIERG